MKGVGALVGAEYEFVMWRIAAKVLTSIDSLVRKCTACDIDVGSQFVCSRVGPIDLAN